MTNKRYLILYSTAYGRNDGAPLFYYNVLKNQLKLDVTHLSPKGDISNFGSFDYTFWVDYGEDGLPEDHDWKIPANCGKTIYVASDTHLDNGYRLGKALDFDHVFFNQKRAVDKYKEFLTHPFPILRPGIENQTVTWLPHAAEPQAYPKLEIIKKWDVCFVGHVQETANYNDMTRIDALDRLFKEFPNFYYGSRNSAFPGKNLFEDAAKKFSQSKIVFNISIKDDLNMRLFETLMTGSFLLTNRIPILRDLEDQYDIKEGVHFAAYETYEEMIEKAHYYLEHDEDREAIANAGYKAAIEAHTYKHRVETILKLIG